MDGQNAFYSSVDGVLFDKSQTSLLQYPDGITGGYTVPESVTSIGAEAFGGCAELTGITIPAQVTSIGEGAFYDCPSLASVIIPASVTNIGSSAFEACIGLTNIYFKGNAPNAGSAVFAGYDTYILSPSPFIICLAPPDGAILLPVTAPCYGIRLSK